MPERIDREHGSRECESREDSSVTQASTKPAPFNEPLAVPKELASRRNWICWRAVWDEDKQKWDKIPVLIGKGSSYNWTKPENHVAYDEAVAALSRHSHLAGIGFVLTEGCGLIGGDMDKCRDPATGVIEQWAQAIIDRRETYFEVSPSGKGVRFWALTDVPVTLPVPSAGVELHSTGKFLTFTGDHIAGTPWEIGRAPATVDVLMQRVAAHKAAYKAAQPSSGPGPSPAAPDPDAAFNRYVYQNSPMGKINQAALKDLKAWVLEIFPTAELQPGTGAYRVKSKDLGRGLEEDLSLSPDGIKDFGVHDLGDAREGKRTPIDVVIEWLDVKPKLDATEAAEWLGKRLNIPFDSSSGSSPGPDAAVQGVPPLKPVSPTAFVGRTPPAREWIVQDWVPCGVVTGLYGDGGTGKSLLAQQLQTSTALGQTWIGQTVQQCVSLGLYCEDDEDELWRRQDAINAASFCDHGMLGPMHVLARPVSDNALMVFARNGIGETTQLHKRLVEAALDLGARLVVVDTAADTFMGTENDRGQVRQFVQRALGSIAVATRGAVVCCAHPSLSGLISGTGTAGSTGWNNAFRSRHYLELPKDEPEDTPLRVLTRKKANYAARGTVLGLRWSAGVLIPDGANVAQRSVEDVFVDLLCEMIRQGRPVSSSRTARNSPKQVFGSLPKADRFGYSGDDFMRAMETLLRSGVLISSPYKNKGYESFKLEFPLASGNTGTSPGPNSPF
jgi:hypothetical protein